MQINSPELQYLLREVEVAVFHLDAAEPRNEWKAQRGQQWQVASLQQLVHLAEEGRLTHQEEEGDAPPLGATGAEGPPKGGEEPHPDHMSHTF